MGFFGKAIKNRDLLELYRIYKGVYTKGSDLEKALITTGNDTQFLIDVNEDEKLLVVTFQGSYSIIDWMNDFNGIEKTFLVLNNKKIKGHSGFYNAYFSAKPKIKEELFKAIEEHPDFQVIFFGHSLGAAIAQVGALDYFKETGKKAKVITYGTPKVFSDDSLDIVRETIEAVVEVDRSNDMVTWFTPWYSSNLAGHKDYRIGKFNVLHYACISQYHTTYDDINLYDENLEVVRNRLSEMAQVL